MSTPETIDDAVIYHGDCRAILPTLAAGSVDAIVTDPPYGTQVDRDGYGRRQNYGGVGRKIEGDADLSALAGMLTQAARLLAPNSWIAIFCSPKRHVEAATLVESHGFTIIGEAIWDKAAPGLGGGIRYQHETILLCGHGRPPGRDSLISVIRSHIAREGKAGHHPHEKPVPLMAALVRYCSRPGEMVLDPFAGSGTTLVACAKMGRRSIGIEIDGRYIETIKRRLTAASTPLFADMEAIL